jgi:antibiotic biosynthesis monooxygenase (ABM) superfamily enzyme
MPGTAATLVTQTRVREGKDEAFAQWQQAMSQAAAECRGFIEQSIMPPSPPAQTDWVILQRFASDETAVGWLRSDRRLVLLAEAQPLLVGPDDVHLVRDTGSGVLPAPISVVISTRIKPGCETEFRRWEQKIATAQARSVGFQGYRFEPPVPGVQEDWLAILRFDTEPNLQAWLASPDRLKLLKEADAFTEEVHLRVARTGFEQWFTTVAAAGGVLPAWKQNMIVLLLLYPVVFLFGTLVQTPLLMDRGRLPFWLALFISNIASVILLSWLVPWTSRRFGWWLSPTAGRAQIVDIAGAAIIIALYAVLLCIFWQLSPK